MSGREIIWLRGPNVLRVWFFVDILGDEGVVRGLGVAIGGWSRFLLG